MVAVDDNDPRPVLRKELSRVFQNQRVVRAFEKIFDLIPPEFINQQIQIDAVNLVAELGAAQSIEAVAAVTRLAEAIERLAVAPPIVDSVAADDLRPRDEFGTMAAQQVDAVDIKAGSVIAALTDSTTNLIASSVALANNAAAAGATLLNAPVAGNPTKWVPVNDNGVIRNSPLW